MNHTQIDRQSNRSSESGSQNQVSITIAPSSGRNGASRSSSSNISNSPLPQKRDNQSLPPIPDESEPTPIEGPDIIPAAVLQRLGFQSETANPAVGDNGGFVKDGKEAAKAQEGENGVEQGETGSRNNSVSVKDRAKLIENGRPKDSV